MCKNILVVVLLSFVFAVHYVSAEDISNKSEFQVKLPDGLYLYQPKIKEEVFSPLFIVEKGSLVDPYALAEKLGKEKFIKEYIEGRDFNIYVGGDLVGKLSKVEVEIVNECESIEFLSDIRCWGKYEGRSLKKIYLNKSLVAAKGTNRSYGEIKAIAAPAPVKTDKTAGFFRITREDEKRASVVSQQKIAPKLFEFTKKSMQYLHEEKQIITASDERIGFIKAFDIDGNEQKDIIGSYIIRMSHKDDTAEGIYHGYFQGESLFVNSDNGDMQGIFSSVEVDPGFSLGGAIDIDQDGIYELVIQENDSDYESGIDNVRRIEVFRRTSTWKSVYLTDAICGLTFQLME